MKKDKTQVSNSKRGFLKGLGAVAAATPIIGSMFGSDDANAAKADHEMYLRGTYFESCTCNTDKFQPRQEQRRQDKRVEVPSSYLEIRLCVKSTEEK